MSFARHGRSQVQSFPRKACPELAEGRESTPQAIGNTTTTDWIPALRQAQGKLFAGMTSVSKGIPFQMTPQPTGENP